MRYAFGSYTFDPAGNRLHCHGVALPVKPKTADVLAYLLLHPDRVVTKDELLDALWPGEDVTEANLAQHVFLLRQIFATHSPDQTFIVTNARRGYRFAAPVRAVAEDSLLGRPGWRAYAQGRFYADQRTAESLSMALRAYETAYADEADFSAALSGIAWCRTLRAEYLFASPDELDLARSAALRAVEIDPDDIEGHLALGDVALFRDWNPALAHASYERALWLDPAGTRTRVLRAWIFGISADYDRAMREIEIALAREPLSLELLTMLGVVELMRGDFAAAVEHCDGVLEMDAGYGLARYYRRAGMAYGDRPGDALRAFDDEAPAGGYPQQSLAVAAYAAARCGQRERAGRMLDQLRGGDFAYVSPVNVAHVLAGLDDRAGALRELERAVDVRDAWSIFVPTHPAFRDLGIDAVRKRIAPTAASC